MLTDSETIHVVRKERNKSEFYCSLALDEYNDNEMKVSIIFSTHEGRYSFNKIDNDSSFSFCLRRN